MGMIDNTAPPVPPELPPMDPRLEQIEQKVEASMTDPKTVEAYHKIVNAGMKVAFDETTHKSLMQDLENSKDPVHDVAVGTVGLLITLHQQSKGTMPLAPMVQAGMTLMLHGLDYLIKLIF